MYRSTGTCALRFLTDTESAVADPSRLLEFLKRRQQVLFAAYEPMDDVSRADAIRYNQ